MSGRKQHYLPQFLQRPFSHRVVKNNFYVHVHEQRTRYSPSTSGVGAKRDFYSSTLDTRADDNVTAAESAYAELLSQIIQTKSIPLNGNIQGLFSSLSIRTLRMRNAIADLAPMFISTLRKKAIDESSAKNEIEMHLNDQAFIDSQIEEQLRSIVGLDRNKRAVLKSKLRLGFKLQYEKNKEKLLNEFNELACSLLSKLEEESSKIADQAFSNIFSETGSLDKRDELFSAFKYELIERKDEYFILGDCAVVALDNQNRPRLVLANVDDDIVLNQVFLPISPNLLIYGARDTCSSGPNEIEINEMSAMLSNTFFISFEESTPHIEYLKSIIGNATVPLIDPEELAKF